MAKMIPEIPTVGIERLVKGISAAAVALKYATGTLSHLGLNKAIT